MHPRSFLMTTAALVSTLLMGDASTAVGQALFFDDFNTDSSGNYSIVSTSDDVETNFAFDYSTLGIPSAPHTPDGSTLGLQMKANIEDPDGDGTDVREALTLHTNQQFSGSIMVRFDMWMNANGPMPGGGHGSTEFMTVGVGGDGSTVNDNGVTGVGAWTAVAGEGGSTRDYRMYKDAGEQFAESGQFNADTVSAPNGGGHNASHEYYSQFGNVELDFLPVQGGTDNQVGATNSGVIGFGWHPVRLIVSALGGTGTTGPAVQWRIDSSPDENGTELTIGTLDAGIGSPFSVDGSVTLGYVDPFNSVSDNPKWSFGVADNLTVTSLTGDMDLDGDADFDDIAPFVLGINDPDAYESNLGVPSAWAGDTDGDGDLDFDDIAGFVVILGGGAGDAAVPEPSSLVLLVASTLALLLAPRRSVRA